MRKHIYDPAYYRKNAEKIRQINNDWYKEHREVNRASHRRTYYKYKDNNLCVYCGQPAIEGRSFCSKHQISKTISARNHRLKRKYKKTQEEINQILESQGYRCAICREIIATKYCIDHSHELDTVRGLLCSNCNVGIGHFRESVDFLHSAIRYLESHK